MSDLQLAISGYVHPKSLTIFCLSVSIIPTARACVFVRGNPTEGVFASCPLPVGKLLEGGVFVWRSHES
ncbi:MAG: hypothetical protein G01um101448_775 [Parcubacteria group bacterium Gr01-1014_48]|nr:MAG: hypothetical protein Greene041614_588 [Parcubacteria group bacterium Greene0416_14]TSC73423.1 MAG: hypothetical protein G01um101448_775 [Parcubacteria group bacterium Gr01-1014_48]TSD00836.1 MAG: hypothetical protein Greene101415_637 [Parcubacteria group bacterium Greene1014_15]